MEFSRNDIDKLVEYINIELKKNKKASVNKLCDKIGIKQSTFKTWAHKSGFAFDEEIRAYTKVTQKDKHPKTKEKTHMEEAAAEANIDMEKLEELVDLLEPIKKLIANYNKITLIDSPSSNHEELNPPAITNVKQKLFKIDTEVLKDWESFVADHKQFKVQNLISLALKEFIEKYK